MWCSRTHTHTHQNKSNSSELLLSEGRSNAQYTFAEPHTLRSVAKKIEKNLQKDLKQQNLCTGMSMHAMRWDEMWCDVCLPSDEQVWWTFAWSVIQSRRNSLLFPMLTLSFRLTFSHSHCLSRWYVPFCVICSLCTELKMHWICYIMVVSPRIRYLMSTSIWANCVCAYVLILKYPPSNSNSPRIGSSHCIAQPGSGSAHRNSSVQFSTAQHKLI